MGRQTTWSCHAVVHRRGSHVGVRRQLESDSLEDVLEALASAALEAADTAPDDIGLVVQASVSRHVGKSRISVSTRADYSDKLDPAGASALLSEMREVVRCGFETASENDAETAGPERDWEGQVLRDRKTGNELLRNEAIYGYKPGQVIVVGRRRYVVSAIEDDGDTILLDLS